MNRYAVEECSVMPGSFWVCDTSKPRRSSDFRVEWHATQEEADRDARAKNEGKTRVVAPLTEEQKQQRRDTLERNRKAKKDGAEHTKTTGSAGGQRRRKGAS